MFQDAFAGLKAQVQAVKQRVTLLQVVHHAQALQVVLKTAVACHAFVEGILPGMAKGGVAQVMRQRNRLNQVFIEAQRAGDGAAQLRHLQGVRQARAEQVAFMVEEHLRLVNQPAESGGVDNAVAVSLELCARRSRHFWEAPPA